MTLVDALDDISESHALQALCEGDVSIRIDTKLKTLLGASNHTVDRTCGSSQDCHDVYYQKKFRIQNEIKKKNTRRIKFKRRKRRKKIKGVKQS